MLPYIVVFGKGIPVFGICMALGVMTASVWACLRAYSEQLLIEDMIIYIACVCGMCMLGAKLFYCLVTYGVSGSFQLLWSGRAGELLEQGGFVFYGGMIGGLAGLLLAKKITGAEAAQFYGSAVPVIPIGHAIGRVGCFFAGCCYGKEYEGFGSVRFPHSVSGLSPDTGVIPTQLIEAFGNILIAVYLFQKYKGSKNGKKILGDYVLLYAVMRFLLEFLRGDAARGGFAVFSTSQWISIILIAVQGGFYFKAGWKNEKLGKTEQ